MTREEKIKEFVKNKPKRWCELDRCRCIGCINRAGSYPLWKDNYPDEDFITKDEFIKYVNGIIMMNNL